MAERMYSVSHRTAFDRFIPYRPNLDVDISHARLMYCSSDSTENEYGQNKNHVTRSYERLLSEGNILPIRSSPVSSPFTRRMKQLFPSISHDEGYDSPRADRQRKIPTSPGCIMDMPGIRNDYYTHLLDWSNRNLVAVALDQSAYVWDADSKNCQKIDIHFPEPSFYISALCWSKRDKLLAISDNDGEITICDVEKMKSQTKFVPFRQKCSVGILEWTDYGIISGNKKGEITLYDVRCKDGTGKHYLPGHHGREVCGLQLAPGTCTSYLASGGDDGYINIWEFRMMKNCSRINAHKACVKAIGWCPWNQGIIASGGGSSDGYLRLWQAHTGKMIEEKVTKSQVCGLLWSEEYKEIVSAHGSSIPEKNDLIVWDMKQFGFDPVAKLRQHMARPLHIALSPDKTTVASAGADDVLCLWNTFPRKSRTQSRTSWDRSPLNMFKYIR